jgi:hypothetical protein
MGAETMLKPGEAAVLIVRRSDQDHDKYFLAVRRSETSFFDGRNDFEIGPFQIPVRELREHSDCQAALNQAVEVLKNALSES